MTANCNTCGDPVNVKPQHEKFERHFCNRDCFNNYPLKFLSYLQKYSATTNSQLMAEALGINDATLRGYRLRLRQMGYVIETYKKPRQEKYYRKKKAVTPKTKTMPRKKQKSRAKDPEKARLTNHFPINQQQDVKILRDDSDKIMVAIGFNAFGVANKWAYKKKVA